ncbi:hypothetical protein EMMF5_002129 [Cystobasidiomycetes sp. EMM_F5]
MLFPISSSIVGDKVVYCYKGYKDNKDLEGDNIKWVTLSLGSFLFPHRMLTYQITRFSNGEIADILESPAKGKWANVTANATKKEPFVVITNLNTHKKTCLPFYVVSGPYTDPDDEGDSSDKSNNMKASTSSAEAEKPVAKKSKK